MTWYLESQTVHRFAALPAWLGQDMSVYAGSNQDPAFLEKIQELIATNQDYPRRLMDDDGFFMVLRDAIRSETRRLAGRLGVGRCLGPAQG